MRVWILSTLFGSLAERKVDPEFLRNSFDDFKAGDELEHRLFCHDIGPNPGNYLRHVHFIPTVGADQAQWMKDYNSKHNRQRRTSDRYVLYAQDRTGFLLIDILDDPGAHQLWKNRRTRLEGYESVASNFCTHGFKAADCR